MGGNINKVLFSKGTQENIYIINENFYNCKQYLKSYDLKPGIFMGI